MRFYDPRRTFATLLFKENYPKLVQQILGHLTIIRTVDIYSHALPDVQDRAVNVLQEV